MSNTISTALIIPTVHDCYKDHFEGNPIVPGAVLLTWIFEKINSLAPEGKVVYKIKTIKFLDIVRPGDICSLRLDFRAEGQGLSLSCTRDNQVVLKGKLELTKSNHTLLDEIQDDS
ncbi:MAG: hypothetical protein COA42_23425 [Alteromonadaceae bacterium]|nr:MAG: hypothetical protein COA42_23425 [Alteromonadaceae bacterium]